MLPLRAVPRLHILWVGLAIALGSLAPDARALAPQADYVAGEALVIFKTSTSEGTAAEATASHHLEAVRSYPAISRERGCQHWHVRSSTQTTAELIAELQLDPAVELAEPNYLRHVSAMPAPNDTYFTNLWGLRNTGQTVNGTAGTSGADIHFLDAWGMAKPNAPEVVVAVIDTGIDLGHPDLAANLWTNRGEIAGDGLDNDGNGKVDDVHGYDFIGDGGNPSDSGLHGTHVSGIIAAVANNSLGVVGAAFNTRIMALKVSADGDIIDTASELAALNYAVLMKNRGVNIVAINASYGGSIYSANQSSAIQAAGNVGIVYCTAAGNGNSYGVGVDNTITPTYPANYRLPNMIVVAASDSTDKLASFSNFGSKVDLAAPGTNIYSTIPTLIGTTSTLTRSTTSYTAAPFTYAGISPGISGSLYHCGLGNPGEFPAAVKGNIALIQRGTLTFADKVTNAMKAGALAAVIYNNATGTINGTLGSATPTTINGTWIPTVAISQADGQTLEAALPTTVSVSNVISPASMYTYENGTSMATPYVSAAVAFAAANFPNESVAQRVARVVASVTPVPALTGKVISGGRLNLARVVDSDSNGLPDWWELAYFGHIGVNPAADADGDGFTNLQEYLLGTLPNNPFSKLSIAQISVVPNGINKDFRISFATALGITYRVEFSDSLAAGSWLSLGSEISGTGNPATATDAAAVSLHPRRFYRVRIITP